MTNSKNTKRALLSSVLAMLVCVAMLVGSTFAWFTDSVSTGKSIIQSGNLDISAIVYDMEVGGSEDEDAFSDVFGTLYPTFLTGDFINRGSGDIGFGFGHEDVGDGDGGVDFEGNSTFMSDSLFEPGKTYVKMIRVKNEGNLAAKIKLHFDVTDGGLQDALWFALAIPEIQLDGEGKTSQYNRQPMSKLNEVLSAMDEVALAPKGESGTIADEIGIVFAYGMNETAGNDYQGKSFEAAMSIVATQYTYENDSFNNQYDKDAPLDFVPVSTVDGLKKAIENGGSVMLTGNIDAGNEKGSKFSVTGDTTINGNGKIITTADPDMTAYVSRVVDMDSLNNATLTIADATITGGTVKGSSPYLYRGISLYNNVNPVLNISNSSVVAGHYAVNIAGDNVNPVVDIRNSSLTGYCAFQTHSANTKATFTDCTLTGVNQWSGDGNGFSTVVINEPAVGSECTFNNCKIIANRQDTADESLFSLETDCKVNLNGCTFVKNGVEIPAAEVFANLQKTDDQFEDIYNDYVYIYGGTNVTVMIDGRSVDLTVG